MSAIRSNSPGLKAAAIAALALLLLVPLALVAALIGERQQRAHEAERTMAMQWGQAQILAPAYLHADRAVRWQTESGFRSGPETHVLLPDSVQVRGELTTEIRERGIFRVPVYTTRLLVRARFAANDVARLREASNESAPLRLRLALSDPRGLREFGPLAVDGVEQRAAAAGRELIGLRGFGLDLGDAAGDVDVEYAVTLAGVNSLRVLPLGRTTDVEINGAWGDPSFIGGFLPATRDIGPTRFEARWQVLELSRDFAQTGALTSFDSSALEPAAFGVALYQPVDLYQQNERSGKYGVLVIALLFIALFLFEILSGVPLHPLQYVLIGLALATFYLLLLALSEHIGFGWAYLVAASAAVILIGAYATAALQSRRRALALAGLQAAAYGVFYALVRSEDYALLMGASVLFAAIAAVMWLTRRTDWYALGGRSAAATG
jgi:inner membrane protein